MKRLTMVRGTVRNLGKWIQIPHLVKSWQYDIEKDTLIYYNKQKCDIFRRSESRQTREGNIFQFTEKRDEYENVTVPTTVTWQGYNLHKIRMKGFGKYVTSYEKEEMLIHPIKNDKYISFSSTRNKEALWEAARKGELRAVADASYSPMFSTTMAAAAWLMETEKRRFSWNGSGLCTEKYNS